MSVTDKICTVCKIAPVHIRSYCIACKKAYDKAYYARKHVEIKARLKALYRSDKEFNSKVKAAARKWRSDNPERSKQRTDAWLVANPLRARAIDARRSRCQRGKVKLRHPKWLSLEDKKLMIAIYQTAQQLTQDTGIRYEVDHIYPLRGRLVSGLHVPFNLRILTKVQNRKKAATFSFV